MKLLVLASLFAMAMSHPAIESKTSPIPVNYHSTVGIKEAERIKAAEEAVDFTGSRIIGGMPSQLGAHPHLGGLVIALTSGETSVCGCSLLNNVRAVTAAHCWWDGTNQAVLFTAVFGSITLFTGGTRVPSNNVEVHQNWNTGNLQNDVAVITLQWVAYNNNIVRNIGLPSGALSSSDFVGVWAQAAGYGRTGDTPSEAISTGQTQRHVNLQVIWNFQCENVFGAVITASTLCTDGSNRQGTCGGDSGGPLSITIEGQTVLIGISSFNSPWGCTIGFPSAFTRVTSFADWIRARL